MQPAAAVYLVNNGGTAAWNLTIPPGPLLYGVEVFGQVLVLNGLLQPQAVTNALGLRVGT